MRWAPGSTGFMRAAVPTLIQPVLAFGIHGGGASGSRTTACRRRRRGGATYWLATPGVLAAELRVAVEASF
ncbi:MAG: hypothetical protein R3F60_30810 [bacterium]